MEVGDAEGIIIPAATDFMENTHGANLPSPALPAVIPFIIPSHPPVDPEGNNKKCPVSHTF